MNISDKHFSNQQRIICAGDFKEKYVKGGDNSCVMGPLPGFFGLRGAIGVAVGGGWVFRVFIGSWVDYRDVYYESSMVGSM